MAPLQSARHSFRLCWRPLREGELDHELIWASVSMVSVAFGILLLKLHVPLPTCLLHDLTGLPCPTCGATRCFIQLLNGNFRAALGWNPGAFSAFIALCLFNLYAVVVVSCNLPRLRIALITPKAAMALRGLAWSAAALNWIYLIVYLP